MIFLENADAHLQFLMRMEIRIKKRMRQLPSDKLIKKTSHGRKYYYLRKQGKNISLQSQPSKLQNLLEYEKLQKELAVIENNIRLLSKFVEKYTPIMSDNTMWDSMQEKQNQYRSEELKHLYKGKFYRSKSELAIAMMLTSYNLEFKYETSLESRGRYIYPDFAVKRKTDGKVILWEHFGLIGNKEYRESMFRKLADYHEAGYDLWDGLIATFDKEDGSINGDIIEKIINVYLM